MSINIEITDDNLCKIVTCKSGIKENKYITYNELIKLFMSSSNEYKDKASGKLTDILPGDNIISTIQVKEIPETDSKWYVMLREQVPTKFTFNSYKKTGKKTMIFNKVALPRMIIAVKVCNNKCVSAKIACVKNGFVTSDTPMFKWPYSNIFADGRICWGGNTINDFFISDLSNITMIPEMFLAMENNSDGYYGANYSELEYEELLEIMDGAKFDNDILKPLESRTYANFVGTLR